MILKALFQGKQSEDTSTTILLIKSIAFLDCVYLALCDLND